MNIAIIGSGNVGSALAAGCHKAKHKVVFGVRDPQSEKTKKAVEQLSDLPLLSIMDAAIESDVIVIPHLLRLFMTCFRNLAPWMIKLS